MAKKVVKKTVTTESIDEEGNITKKIKHTSPSKKKKEKKDSLPKKKKMTAREREELLIENFVGLQNAMTNLSIKFGNLSDNINNLLRVFEEAAKSYARGTKTDNEDMLNKINSLLDQNKTIAKGLVLMESKIRGSSENMPSIPRQSQRPNQEEKSSSTNNFSRPLPSI